MILYGFDANEWRRIQRRSAKLERDGYKADFPLANWTSTIFSTEEIGIKRPSTYDIWKHANCQGCLKAGKQHWYCVYCLRPDIWNEAKIAEDIIGYSIIKGAYLYELEPLFYEMRYHKGICPTENINSATFWSNVNKALPEQTSIFPCDCAV